jgi:hypothetical protein
VREVLHRDQPGRPVGHLCPILEKRCRIDQNSIVIISTLKPYFLIHLRDSN